MAMAASRSRSGRGFARRTLPGERGDDRLVEPVSFAGEILIAAHQLGETIAAGGDTHRELVHGGRGRGLRAVLDDIERLVKGLVRRHQLLLLRVEQRGKRNAGLRAAASHHPLHQRQGIGSASFRLIERGQVVQARHGVRMVGADRALADGERALIDRLGLGKAVLALDRGRRGC